MAVLRGRRFFCLKPTASDAVYQPCSDRVMGLVRRICAEIKIRAERKGGKMLAEQEKN